MLTIDECCIIFIFIVLLLYIISMINRFSVSDLPLQSKYIDQSEMNTGDLLCVSYNNVAGAFVGTFTRSVWVHTGMIWCDPDTKIKYVLEGAIYGHPEYKQFYMIPIATWMYINKNNVMGFKKYHGPDIDSKIMIDSFKPFMEQTNLEGLNPWWLRFLMNNEYEEYKPQKKITCFESTVVLGQSAGIFAKEKHYSSYFPCDIVNNKISCVDNVYYDQTIQIHMNEIEKNLLFVDMNEFFAFWQK